MGWTTSGTVWLWMLMTLLWATATVLSYADGDLKCSCRFRTHKDVVINVTCSNVQNGTNEISCLKGERRTASPPTPRYARDDFMPLSSRSMVFFSRTGNAWQGARSACALMGADLLVPRDRSTLQLLTQSPFFEMFTETEAFIGVSDLDSEGNFVDVEGNPADYLVWRPGEPNNANDNEDCVAWNKAGVANDRVCSQALQYLCEWRLHAEPPRGYDWVGAAGSFLRLSADRRGYEAAAAACEEDGGQLFVPDTAARAEALLRHVPVDCGEMLVGATDRPAEGVFVTDKGEPLSDWAFHDWLPGQPDDGAGAAGEAGEDCVALHSHGFLADVSCEQPRRYVCEWLP